MTNKIGKFEIEEISEGHLVLKLEGHDTHIVANFNPHSRKVSSIRVDIYEASNLSEISNAKAEIII